MSLTRRGFLGRAGAAAAAALAARAARAKEEPHPTTRLFFAPDTIAQVYGRNSRGEAWRRELYLDGLKVVTSQWVVKRVRGRSRVERVARLEYDQHGGTITYRTLEGAFVAEPFVAGDAAAVFVWVRGVPITPELARRVTLDRYPECA